MWRGVEWRGCSFIARRGISNAIYCVLWGVVENGAAHTKEHGEMLESIELPRQRRRDADACLRTLLELQYREQGAEANTAAQQSVHNNSLVAQFTVSAQLINHQSWGNFQCSRAAAK